MLSAYQGPFDSLPAELLTPGVHLQARSRTVKIRDGVGFAAPMREVTAQQPVWFENITPAHAASNHEVFVVPGRRAPSQKLASAADDKRIEQLEQLTEELAQELGRAHEQLAASTALEGHLAQAREQLAAATGRASTAERELAQVREQLAALEAPRQQGSNGKGRA